MNKKLNFSLHTTVMRSINAYDSACGAQINIMNREPSGFRIENYSSPSCKKSIIRNHVLVSSHRFISENGFSRPSLQTALNMKFESKTVKCPKKDCQGTYHLQFKLTFICGIGRNTLIQITQTAQCKTHTTFACTIARARV